MSPPSTGAYVFGVTTPEAVLPEALDASPLATAVRGVVVDDLCAVVGDVDVADLRPDHAEDPAWLVPRARAHDAVLRVIVEASPVVPFRFGVIHLDDTALAASVAASHEWLHRALQRVRNAQEWTLELVAASRSAAARTEAPGATRGRSYLAARQVELTASEHMDEAADAALWWCRDRGIPAAPISPAGGGGSRLACLIARGGVDDVLAGLASGSTLPTGVVVRATGPLPPYRFVDDDGS